MCDVTAIGDGGKNSGDVSVRAGVSGPETNIGWPPADDDARNRNIDLGIGMITGRGAGLVGGSMELAELGSSAGDNEPRVSIAMTVGRAVVG